MPGVLGVFTGADCAADKLKPIPHDPVPKTKYDMKLHAPGGGAVFIGPHMLLPADKARHVGEAVAMVVAETQAQALDAAEAVDVDYEELPFVLHSEDAMQPGAPAVWDEVTEQRPGRDDVRRRGSDRPGFRERRRMSSDEEFPYRPRHRRAAGAARRAWPLRRRNRTLHALCRHRRRGAAEERAVDVLGIPPERLRVLSYDVGGNFGTRNRVFVEFGLVLWAAQKARPAGQIHRDALGSLSQRLSGPRSRHQGRARARRQGQLPRHARRPISAMSARAACRCRR